MDIDGDETLRSDGRATRERWSRELLARGRSRHGKLTALYRDAGQIGLVLGAGASIDSSVPDYDHLVLTLLESALRDAGKDAPDWAWAFLDLQRYRRESGRERVPPDVVAMFARLVREKHSVGPLPVAALADALWGAARVRGLITSADMKNRYVRKEAWAGNSTLNAVITLCSDLQDGRPQANWKIGAILTTNYDNLVEGACRAKYRTVELLKPVARSTSKEGERTYHQIPVYHIHGYLSYRRAEPEPGKRPVVIEESDYFDVFYDALGFGNYMAMAFFRRFPTLFIGSALTDKNIRRLLHRLAQDSDTGRLPNQAFALVRLPTSAEGLAEALVTDDVLHAYGVEAIWVASFGDIPKVLKELYVSAGDRREHEKRWDDLWDYSAYRHNPPERLRLRLPR
jgi:hypothetical protein